MEQEGKEFFGNDSWEIISRNDMVDIPAVVPAETKGQSQKALAWADAQMP
mgnify:CR=1 FL=1